MSRPGRRRAVVVAVVAVGAVLVPLVRGPAHDSFPLSTYPMFSNEKAAEAAVATVVGIEADGGWRTLSPELIAGTDEVILAAETVNRAVGAGPARAAALCQDVAGRLDGDDGAGLTAVEVVTARYDTVAYLQGDERPRAVLVHARCVP